MFTSSPLFIFVLLLSLATLISLFVEDFERRKRDLYALTVVVSILMHVGKYL